MRAASFQLALAVAALATLISGSARGTSPPLEQLSLRDALLARPEVIAALPPDAHLQLTQRFEEARQQPGSLPGTLVATDFSPVEQVRVIDTARLARGSDALVAAQLRLGPVGLDAQPYTEVPAAPAAPLPPLGGVPAGATADDEAQALRGTAGAVVSGLLQKSQASRLVRVESWPMAVVAIGDALYVNAAWLVALAPPSSGGRAAPTRAAGPAIEGGCGSAVVDSSQGSLPAAGAAAAELEATSPEHPIPAPARPMVDAPLRGIDEVPPHNGAPETLWTGHGGGTTAPRTAASDTADLPISSLRFALTSGATTPTDCCRYTSSNGCDTQTPCDSGGDCSSSNGGSGCNSGSSGSGCSSGSGGCSSGSGGCSSGSGGCSSGSSGCSSGSGGCSSGSGGCSSGSSGSSCGGSGCGSSGCGSSKCTLAPPRPVGEIPDLATLAFLLAPLFFLLRSERRSRA
jgi:uncharacterized membrane protein YgcG